VVVPKIVYDELAAVYEREVVKRSVQFVRAKNSLTSILLKSKVPDVSITAKDEVNSYLEHVKRVLEVKDNEIFDYKESYLHDVVNRAINRRRPCTDRGEEIRDAILWHCVLDIAQETGDKRAILISNNTKQFADGTEDLHADLLQESGERGVTVKYFPSLDSFVKHHASQIEFITEEWILERISTDEILRRAPELIESLASIRLSDSLDDEEYPTGYINVTHASSLDLDTFYVYEMSDGSFRVEASFEGEIEAECEIEKVTTKEEYDYDWSDAYEVTFSNGMYDFEPTIRTQRQLKSICKYVYPCVAITVDIIVREKAITQWHVVHGELT